MKRDWELDGSRDRRRYLREKMTKVMLSRPIDGSSPTLFGRLGNDLVENLERKVLLRLQGLEGLGEEG